THRTGESAARCGALSWPAGGLAVAGCDRAAGPGDGARGAALVPVVERRGEPVDGRVRAAPRPVEPEATVRAVSDPREQAPQPGPRAIGRSAADGGDRSRADGQPRR